MKVVLSSQAIRVSAQSVAGALAEFRDSGTPLAYIEVEHAEFGDLSKNLMQVARASSDLRRQVFALAENGFVAYAHNFGLTKFAHLSLIPRLWEPVRTGKYSYDPAGLVYSVEVTDGVPVEALLVVFSSMSMPFDKASLTRYFEHNFSSVKKHLPDGVAVLRIADLDGVVGGFYLPTVNYPNRSSDVDALIRKVASRLGVDFARVVVYGASKGGTAALYYGLRYGYRFVAVDPVVDDESYEDRYDDTHWTRGNVFLARKRDIFRDLAVSSGAVKYDCGGAVVTGRGSPLYRGVENLVNLHEENGGKLFFLVSKDPRITDHPHVSIRTLRTVTGLLNVAVQGIDFPHSRQEIFG